MEVCDEPVISKELMELRYPELDPGTLFGHTLVHMSDEWEIATGEERKYDFLEVSPYIPEE